MAGQRSEWRDRAPKAHKWQDADEKGTEPKPVSERDATRADLKQGETWLTSSFRAGTSDTRAGLSLDGKQSTLTPFFGGGLPGICPSGVRLSEPFWPTPVMWSEGCPLTL